ncbi:MAG: hypothetical protein BWY32_03010 [bacterium ADurb.Bin243]|nr:MAG: hypothetical protein BWY32_03010 [bacterium ADurb.Bin243]
MAPPSPSAMNGWLPEFLSVIYDLAVETSPISVVSEISTAAGDGAALFPEVPVIWPAAIEAEIFMPEGDPAVSCAALKMPGAVILHELPSVIISLSGSESDENEGFDPIESPVTGSEKSVAATPPRTMALSNTSVILSPASACELAFISLSVAAVICGPLPVGAAISMAAAAGLASPPAPVICPDGMVAEIFMPEGDPAASCEALKIPGAVILHDCPRVIASCEAREPIAKEGEEPRLSLATGRVKSAAVTPEIFMAESKARLSLSPASVMPLEFTSCQALLTRNGPPGVPPPVTVRLKTAVSWEAQPGALVVAVITTGPAAAPAFTVICAWPVASVFTFGSPTNVAEPEVTVNVTLFAPIGPEDSARFTLSGSVNWASAAADWPSPEMTMKLGFTSTAVALISREEPVPVFIISRTPMNEF